MKQEEISTREHASARIQTLRSWQSRMTKLIPVVMAVLSGSNFLDNDKESGRELI